MVCQHYARLADEELQRVTAQVTTATELATEQRDAVTQKIADMTHKNVILETHVDPGILGGLGGACQQRRFWMAACEASLPSCART